MATLARMMERSLIVIGGISSIYLGYKLFVLGIGNTQGQASAFGIELKNFGPGLFFAALGAVILVTTMRASIKVGPSASINEQANKTHTEQIETTASRADAVFFGMEDVTRKNNQWTNTAFYLDTRQLLRRLNENESIDKLSDLRESLISKLNSITMTDKEYKRYQELTSKIPLSQTEQNELMFLEEKLFPYDKSAQ